MKKLFLVLLLCCFSIVSADELEALIKKGMKLRKSDRLVEACEVFEQARQKYPNNKEILYQLGISLIRTKQVSKGLSWVKKAADLQPSYDVYFELGKLAEYYEDYLWAQKAYKLCLKYNANVKVYGKLAIILDELGKSQEAWQFRVKRVMEELPEIRELNFKKDVIAATQTRKELEKFLIHDLKKELPPEKAQAIEVSLQALGLAPEDMDIRELYTNLLTEQVAGFYNPETKKLYLISEQQQPSFWDKLISGPKDDSDDRMVLAHEMVHALQDEYFDLLTLHKSTVDNDDKALALTSLIEGDATLAMMEYNSLARNYFNRKCSSLSSHL